MRVAVARWVNGRLGVVERYSPGGVVKESSVL